MDRIGEGELDGGGGGRWLVPWLDIHPSIYPSSYVSFHSPTTQYPTEQQ